MRGPALSLQVCTADGARVYVGTSTGDVYQFDVAAAAEPRSSAGVVTLGKDRGTHVARRGNGASIDCLRILAPDRLITKCINGKIELGAIGGADKVRCDGGCELGETCEGAALTFSADAGTPTESTAGPHHLLHEGRCGEQPVPL